jgi:hypothetical protein
MKWEKLQDVSMDILQNCILPKLDFLSQIRLRQVSCKFYRLEIHDFFNIPIEYLNLLNNEILKNYLFVRYLNANCNPKITNVNHLKKLQKLDAGSNCGIDNYGISGLTELIELNADANHKITNVNHLKKLQKLDANHKITNVNHLKKLQKLDASWGVC